MQTLHHSDYVRISYHPEESILNYQWLNASRIMSESDFKKELEHIPKLSEEYKPIGFLEDNTQRDFIIKPELQNWISQVIAPVQINNGTTKFALTNPSSYVARLSTIQTMDEIKKYLKTKLDVEYFDEHQQAWQWLCREYVH